MFAEPLSGFRQATARPHRTKDDWAHEVAQLLDTRYANMPRIAALVCDNLNTHTMGAFYEAFPAEKARKYVRRIEFVYTPKHGSWVFNVAECELSCMTSQCLSGLPHRRHRDAAIGNSRLGRSNKHQATGRRLAIHYREGTHQTEAALPENLDWTRH